MFSYFFSTIVPFKMENCSRAGQAAYDNMAHERFMLDTLRLEIHTHIMFIALPLPPWLHELPSCNVTRILLDLLRIALTRHKSATSPKTLLDANC
jgi:hypothetical protein